MLKRLVSAGTCKGKDRCRLHIAALNTYYTTGKGPDNKMMSEEQVGRGGLLLGRDVAGARHAG